MSLGYTAVGWTDHKKLYDRLMVGGIALYLAIFLGVSLALHPEATAETLVIRAFGTLAIVMLHVILSIGPLARLDRRFLPLLYNRRHLGVAMFLCAAVHGLFSLVQFHALGVLAPWVNVLGGNDAWGSLAQFPFQVLGVLALFVLFLMAATSHDFWLANLGAPAWKKLHTLVYLAYGLIVMHVVLGILQAERHPVLAGLLLLGLVWLITLHLLAGRQEHKVDSQLGRLDPTAPAWVDLAAVSSLPEDRGRIFCVGPERIAVFRYEGQVSAISNVCRHQNGPLGEGKIVDGCVVCPWHGYQYRPHDGASPPPFTEKVATFRVKVEAGRVFVDPRPLAPGTPVEPARIEPGAPAAQLSEGEKELYVGYLPQAPAQTARFVRRVVWALGAVVALSAGALASLQQPFGTGEFAFGVVTEYEGILGLSPHPVLWRQGEDPRPLLLVGQGKHGADADLAGLDGKNVRLAGSLIRRQGLEMLEILPERTVDLGSAPVDSEGVAAEGGAPPIVPLGRHRLSGEIVDGKCFLGVMKPGSDKPHKACAQLCLRGGAPPLFIVREEGVVVLQLLLVGEQGEALGPEILDLVAESIEIDGTLERQGELLRLRAARSAMKRL